MAVARGAAGIVDAVVDLGQVRGADRDLCALVRIAAHRHDAAGQRRVPVIEDDPAGAWQIVVIVNGDQLVRSQHHLGDFVPRHLGCVMIGQGFHIDDPFDTFDVAFRCRGPIFSP